MGVTIVTPDIRMSLPVYETPPLQPGAQSRRILG